MTHSAAMSAGELDTGDPAAAEMADPAAPDTPERPDPAAPEGRATPQATATVAVRWLGWLLPVALFAWYFEWRLLDIGRVFPLMRGDWSMFIAAPNFVRDGPWFSIPIGEVPGYLAPVGTSLGQTDAMPVLYPVYRALSIVMPHRPFQLIGWELLGSMVATFGIVRRFARGEARAAGVDPLRAELLAAAAGVMLVAQPFYLVRSGHPSLFQMWVLPWALIVAVRVVEARRDGTPPPSAWVVVAPVAVAAALTPYLGLMVLAVIAVPLLATTAGHVRDTASQVSLAVAGFGAVSFVLGFVGAGGRSSSDGFGLYMADAALLVDGGRLSRVWPNTPPDLTYEGYGFIGSALLLTAVAVAASVLVARLRGRDGDHPGRASATWPVWLAVGALMLWALMPVVRVFDRAVLDLNDELDPFARLTASLRANGRFAWPLLWLIGVLTVRVVVRQRRTVVHVAFALAAVLQVGDAVRTHVPTAADQYGPAMAVVREAKATGITRLEFQPPNVWTDCPAWEWGPFETIAQLVTAAGVEGLAVNSGSTARGNDAFRTEICERQRADYLAGRLAGDVLYVIPYGTEPVSDALTCRPTDAAATVCRLAPGTAP